MMAHIQVSLCKLRHVAKQTQTAFKSFNYFFNLKTIGLYIFQRLAKQTQTLINVKKNKNNLNNNYYFYYYIK